MQEGFLKAENAICRMAGMTETFCSDVVIHMTKTFFEIFPDKYLNATYNCARAGMCNSFRLVERGLAWFQRQILIHSPPPLARSSRPSWLPPIRVALITDLHLDPYYVVVSLVRFRKDRTRA